MLSAILGTVLILFKLLAGSLSGIASKVKPAVMNDILVLPVGSGALERRIWLEISQFLDCAYTIKKFPAMMPKGPYWVSGRNHKIVNRFKRDLKKFSHRIPFFVKQIITFQFYSFYQFLIINPCKSIVTFEQSSHNSAVLAYIARLMQKTSISLAHAPTFGENYKHNPCKYCLVFGKSSQDSFERKDSIDCGQVITIGAPNTDTSFKKPMSNKPWNDDVLFLPNYVKPNREFEQDTIFEVIKKFIDTFPEIKVTVKPHLAQKNPYIHKYLSVHSNVNILMENASLSEQIDNHDVTIILGWSSTGLDVIIRKKPLIRLNLFKVDDWFGYSKSGYALDATNYEELCETFRQFRGRRAVNLSAREKILDIHFENQGFAAQKTAQFLTRQLSEIDKHESINKYNKG
ncbi:MAG: hypothetical protein JRI99_13670 [Deltaproteobacteria bacterium]|nr:hypothetical protein [Deltaproteobacteria bacterium]